MRQRITKTKDEDAKRVKQVKTVWSDDEANALLQQGWTLANSGQVHRDEGGFNCKIAFVLWKMA